MNAPENTRSYTLNGILGGTYFSEPVYLDKDFILKMPEMPFSAELMKTLHDWEFSEVFTEGVPQVDQEENKASRSHEVKSSEVSFLLDKQKITAAESFMADFEKYVEGVFSWIKGRKAPDFKAMAGKMKSVCDTVQENRLFILRVMKNAQPDDDDYLISHTARSTVLSLIIGTAIKLPAHRVIELGVSALLHEAGMLNLPPQLYLSNRSLQPKERDIIMAHPLMGYKVLKGFGLPLAICLPALEHHERENGSGYPQKITGNRINLYSKIIAVACSYEALSSGRPHKEAKDGYSGMLELLKNEGKQYDDAIVRALIFTLSIYPIGLYVLLSNGKHGQVVNVNPEKPRFPIVQVFGEINPDGKNKVVETSPGGLSIVRPLTKEEIGSV